jgi:ATP-dependent RNA helicase DeaD
MTSMVRLSPSRAGPSVRIALSIPIVHNRNKLPMTTSFASLGISDKIVSQLEKLGITEPTNIQSQAIPELLAGRDVVGQSQTGTGKTAAFALPILEKIDFQKPCVQALILAPTRELAMQVSEAMKNFITSERRSPILTVYGGQSIEQQIRRLDSGVPVVVGTPGRVIDLINRGKLRLDQVDWFVLDEADEMLSMGFIDDVELILSKLPKAKQTALFSATMAPQIRSLINRFLNSPTVVTVEQPKAAPNKITQQVYFVPRGWNKAQMLQPIMELEQPESAIIFVRTRRAAAELTSILQSAGHSADEYHGDLSQTQRERLLHRFRQSKVRWIVATDIAARGLDVDHLTHVINYDLPDSAENYIHRIGRTGRAGKEGIAISLIHPMDRRKLQVIERRTNQAMVVCQVPSRAQIEAKHLQKVQNDVLEALAGERVASFLPIISQLGEGYDVHTIAAAALQLIYDRTRPAYLDMEEPVPQERNYDREDRGGRGGYDRRGGSRGGRDQRASGSNGVKPVLRQDDGGSRQNDERDYQEARGSSRRRR